MQNQNATAPRSNDSPRSRSPRATGLLLAVAALMLSFSGAAAPALETTDVAPPPLPNMDEAAAPAPTKEPAAAPEIVKEQATKDEGRLSFTTGDRLTEDQLAEYHAHIAAMKANGQHRGVAVYSSW